MEQNRIGGTASPQQFLEKFIGRKNQSNTLQQLEEEFTPQHDSYELNELANKLNEPPYTSPWKNHEIDVMRDVADQESGPNEIDEDRNSRSISIENPFEEVKHGDCATISD